MFWASVGDPLIRAGTVEAGFRRDHEISWIGIQSFGDDLFGHSGAVGICRVDEIDSELDGALQNANCFLAILGRAPNSFACEPHRAAAEAIDSEIAANAKLSRLGGGASGPINRSCCGGHEESPFSVLGGGEVEVFRMLVRALLAENRC